MMNGHGLDTSGRFRVGAGIAGVLIAWGGFSASATANPELVVLSGTAAPGMPAGVVFDYFSDPRVTSAGRIAFWAELAGPGVTPANAGSVWIDNGAGGLVLIRRAGDPSPVAGHHFGALPSFALNDHGHFAFTASLIDTASPVHPTLLGMFRADPAPPGTGLIAIAVEGEPALGLPGATWSGLPMPQLGSHMGQDATAFHANNGGGLWRYVDGQLNLRHATGDVAPGSLLEFSFLDDPMLSGGGFIFRASLAETGSTQPVSSGLFASVMEVTEPLALAGEQAPGLPAGAVFAEFSAQPVSASGRTAFWARVEGPGMTAENDTGIWVQDGRALALLARAGDQAPGAEPGVVFASFGRQVALSPEGTVIFSGTITGSGVDAENNTGVWIRRGGLLMLLAREGEPVSRMPAGVAFASFGPVHINSAGQAAFTAYLRGPAVAPAANFGLFATDRHGELWPIVRRGDLFDVSGTMHAIAEIHFDSGQPGSGQSQFAAAGPNGRLVYTVRFDTQPPQTLHGLYAFTIGCPANCDGSTVAPVLNVDDFTCFINAFASAQALPPEQQIAHMANCDGSTVPPVLNVDDFTCFINAFAAGCP